MLQFPDGFDISLLISDIYSAAVPLLAIVFLVGCGFLLIKILKRAG